MPRKPVGLRLTASTAWYAEGSRKIPPSSIFCSARSSSTAPLAPQAAPVENVRTRLFLESAMQKPDLDTYLRLAVRALPDTANTAQRLSGVMTVLQTAQAALRDGQPDNVSRADMALT